MPLMPENIGPPMRGADLRGDIGWQLVRHLNNTPGGWDNQRTWDGRRVETSPGFHPDFQFRVFDSHLDPTPDTIHPDSNSPYLEDARRAHDIAMKNVFDKYDVGVSVNHHPWSFDQDHPNFDPLISNDDNYGEYRADDSGKMLLEVGDQLGEPREFERVLNHELGHHVHMNGKIPETIQNAVDEANYLAHKYEVELGPDSFDAVFNRGVMPDYHPIYSEYGYRGPVGEYFPEAYSRWLRAFPSGSPDFGETAADLEMNNSIAHYEALLHHPDIAGKARDAVMGTHRGDYYDNPRPQAIPSVLRSPRFMLMGPR